MLPSVAGRELCRHPRWGISMQPFQRLTDFLFNMDDYKKLLMCDLVDLPPNEYEIEVPPSFFNPLSEVILN